MPHLLKWLMLPVLVLLLSTCGVFDPLFDQSYRFRMTVEVDTPDGLKTGSSVYEVTAGDRWAPLPESSAYSLEERGQAVAVDFAPGQTLFALLKTNAELRDIASLSMQTLDAGYSYDGPISAAERLSARDEDRMPTPVDPAIYPMLVTFGDLADPASVRLVDASNLAASFGEGVSLKRITVQITDDPVTTGIKERLEWLSEYPEPSLDATHGPKDFSLPATLHHGAFRR